MGDNADEALDEKLGFLLRDAVAAGGRTADVVSCGSPQWRLSKLAGAYWRSDAVA